MSKSADMQLLQEYATGGSEQAFAELVRRHVNLVYSVALRRVGNVHQAEEVTQAVFIILARKAGRLSENTIVSGWLYQTAQLASASFLRSELRRQRREQEAYMQSSLDNPVEGDWEKLAPHLDEAMARLGEKERNAIVLRFFEGRSFAEVAAALDLNESAVKKRVARGLEKLRVSFARRGFATSSAGLAGAMGAHAVQAAPEGLISSVAGSAAVKGTAAGSSALSVAKTTLKLMAWTKLKTTVMVGVAAILAGSATTVALKKAAPVVAGDASKTLPDGSVINFCSVTFGKEHSFIFAPGWRRFLAPLLPQSWSQQIEATTLTYSSTNDSLVVWTYHENKGRASEAPAHSYVPTTVVFLDEDGNEFEGPPGCGERRRLKSGLLEGSVMPLLPERGKTITMRICPMDYKTGRTYPTEFIFSNPVAKSPLPWNPDPYPITEQAGDFEFTLLDLRQSSTSPRGESWMEARFHISANGKAVPRWQVQAVKIFDCYGNVYGPSTWRRSREEVEKKFLFRGKLSPRTTRKFQFEFSKEKDFAPEELWVIRDLPVEKSKLKALPHLAKDFGGVAAEFLGFQPNGFAFRLSRPADEFRMDMVSVVDDQGRELKDSGGSLEETTRCFQYRIPADARTATFTLAVHRCYFVDFMARPNPGEEK